MATIVINPKDVSDASDFLESYLTSSMPEGDFGKGTSLRDLTIKAIAFVFAFLQNENDLVLKRQSLKTVQQTISDTDPQGLRDAVLAILSNVFVTPKTGLYARGRVYGYLTNAIDLTIPAGTLFTKTTGLVFTIDAISNYFVAATSLIPVVDANGVVLEWQFSLPVVATAPGTGYNIPPGLFATFDLFSPYVTRIENVDVFQGGKDDETIDEILTRAPTAISERTLSNSRSISAVLEEVFADIQSLYVVGYGDPEMQRDRLTGLANHLAVHLGGKVDIFPLLRFQETTFQGVVGAGYARPDGVASVLNDSSVNFSAVIPGSIIKVIAGLPSIPAEFRVKSVGTHFLIIDDTFPLSTGTVRYSVGLNYPYYNDAILNSTTGTISTSVATSGRITLPALPVMDILDVAVTAPIPATGHTPSLRAYVNGPDGFIHFYSQTNVAPVLSSDPTVAPQYQLIVHDPMVAQSTRQWYEIYVGSDFDGLNLSVTYLTLANFANIDAFVQSKDTRNAAADLLLRGHYPVKIAFNIAYKLKASATSALDEAAVISNLVNYINTFDTTITSLDTSLMTQYLRDTYPTINTVYPITINYTLLAPTGELLKFSTVDEVRILSANRVLNPLETLVVDQIGLTAYGVTDRTVRYLTDNTQITMTAK